MFEKTISTLQSFYDAYHHALAEYERCMADLDKTPYQKTSPIYGEMFDQIKQRYNQKISVAFAESNAVIQKDLAASREQVKQIVAAPVIPGIYDTISLIKNHTVSNDEVGAVLQPYVNNYMSCKILRNEFSEDSFGTYSIVRSSIPSDGILPYSEVLEHIDVIQRWTDNFMLLAMSEFGMQGVLQGDLIPNHAVIVNKFILRFTKGAKYVNDYRLGYDMVNPESWYFTMQRFG